MSDPALERLNSLPADEAQLEFLKCCGSKEWARRVCQARPFSNINELVKESETVWWSLDRRDWLEAFRSHPKIGERKATNVGAAAAEKWSAQEQAGIERASQDTKLMLAELNERYEAKFGFIFIICAAGKGSDEMLASLRERIANDLEDELQNAATEQAKITELRIKKLVNT